jgi:EmrB/QacA subfamily drug resistance transporter
MTGAVQEAADDPRRWLTLGVLLLSLVLVVMDNTVLNVAVPTMVRELHTDLPSIQWVIAGYSLVFASLLVIGGRIGDIYGARRTFMLGATLFGIGSAVASAAPSVGVLVVGEAVIEGIGGALMMPASLAIITNTFRGEERGSAFAAWGAVMGAGMAFGPVVGGYLTTYHSWRWAFRINVLVAPIAVLGAYVLVRRDVVGRARERLDLPGAVLVGSGTFSLVFGISQGETYGWASAQIVGSFAFAVAALTAFVVLERHKEAAGTSPLFEFGQLRHLRFRYGLVAQLVLAIGQMGQFFVLPVFLQEVKDLTPATNGLWMLPVGIAILVFAQVGGRLTRVVGTTTIVRVGLVLNALGLLGMALLLRRDVTFLQLVPPFALFGIGIGLAGSQLVNLILADVPADKAGVASGANSTVRQVGSALGVAVMGAILASGPLAPSARLALFVAAGSLAAGAALAFLMPGEEPHVPEEELGRDLYDPLEPVDTHLLG